MNRNIYLCVHKANNHFSIRFAMKTLAILSYIIGAVLLIVSCFTTGITLTWWLGGSALAFLIAGCIFQYNATNTTKFYHHHQ